MDFLFIQFILWAKNEGFQWFNMGMAPLSGLEQHELVPLWHRVGGLIFSHAETWYHFKGLRFYKDKFRPVWEPKYLACPNTLVLPRVLTDLASLVSGGLKGMIGK